MDAAKEYVQSIEDTLMDPEALIEDVIGVNLTEEVERVIEENFPTIPTVEQLENIDINFSGYIPMLDITGPFAFFPSHCYPSGASLDEDEKGMNEATQYISPVIAYVKTGASIEEDIITQLKSLFKFQKDLAGSIATLDILGVVGGLTGTEGLLDGASLADFDFSQAVTAYAREDEVKGLADQFSNRFNVNVTDYVDEASQEFLADGYDFFDQTASLGNFTFKEFAT